MAYAAKINGAWVALVGAFTLDGVSYPANWLDTASPQARASRGIAVIQPAGPVPASKRIARTIISDVGGQPQFVNVLEDIPLTDLKAAIVNAIDGARDERMQSDFTYDFGQTAALADDGASEPAGPRALQMRFDPDQRNWQALQSQAVVAVISSAPDTLMPLRAGDNRNVQTTAAQVLAVTTAMFLRNASILFFAAGLKAQVRAAADATAALAIDTSVGWP